MLSFEFVLQNYTEPFDGLISPFSYIAFGMFTDQLEI